MSNDYDVIVVGARVAGASTAMLLARHGHSVLLLDRATMPSDTVSTHALLRTGVLQLTRWGLADRVLGAGAPPIRQVMLGFGDERIGFDLKDDFGIESLLAPRRIVLDAILVRAALETGVDFVGGTSVKDLLRDRHGRVFGVVAGRATDFGDVQRADGDRGRWRPLPDRQSGQCSGLPLDIPRPTLSITPTSPASTSPGSGSSSLPGSTPV